MEIQTKAKRPQKDALPLKCCDICKFWNGIFSEKGLGLFILPVVRSFEPGTGGWEAQILMQGSSRSGLGIHSHLPLSLHKHCPLYICMLVLSCHRRVNKLIDTSLSPSNLQQPLCYPVFQYKKDVEKASPDFEPVTGSIGSEGHQLSEVFKVRHLQHKRKIRCTAELVNIHNKPFYSQIFPHSDLFMLLSFSTNMKKAFF